MSHSITRTTLTLGAAAIVLAAGSMGAGFAAGQLTGKDIKDKTLGPNDLLVRVAAVQNDDDTGINFTGSKRLLKVVVQAPTKGYLAVTASSDVFNLGNAYALGSDRAISLDDAANNEENCETNVTIPVAAGKHVVSFWAFSQSTELIFDETALQAEFFPFNGVGKQPTKREITGAIEHPVKAGRHSNR
jgi:hypothetical protein